GYTQDKDAYLKRLRRIEGQVRGLQRMVEEDVYCIDVLTQVSAVTRALQAVAPGLLEDHLRAGVSGAGRPGGGEGRAAGPRGAEGRGGRGGGRGSRAGSGPAAPAAAPPGTGRATRANARGFAGLSPRLTRHAHSLRIEEAKPMDSAGSKFSSE